MIHICVFLCALIAPFAKTLEIQQEFHNQEIPELLSTPRNEVPDYEVITIEHKIHKRSINELSIKAKINGTEKEFVLQCVKGFLAGKDTKVWIAEKNGKKFKYTLQKGIMEKVNITFYHDNKTQSTISHVVNKRGISEFSGIIDSDKVIRPLDNYTRKRRDVASELFHESKNDYTKNYHVIYKRSIRPINKDVNNNYNKINKPHQIIENSNLEKPHIVYPEILVYVDPILFKYFNNDIVKTVAYTLTLWNGADLHFRQMKNPEIRLNIAGIVLCQDQIVPQNPFVIRDETLDSFGQFMYNEDQFKLQQDYDIAVLLGADPKFKGGVTGKAFSTGVCSNNTFFEIIESVAVILDDTNLSGSDTVAHELAHLFGVPHDGDKGNSKLDGLGAEACPWSDGFIMSYDSYNAKQFYFSDCSKEIMSFFLSQESTKCLRNNPGVNRTDNQILRILPGKYMSLDEQCQKRGYLKADNVNQNICTNLTCLASGNSKGTVFVAALEGSPCDLEKFCIRGECVKVKFDEADENLSPKILFPPFYQPPGLNKSSADQCKEHGITNLVESSFNDCECHCKYTDPEEEDTIWTYFIDAQDGTLCNMNNGYCKGGKCVDDPDALIKKIISTTSETITNFDHDNNINDYETTAASYSETTSDETTTTEKSTPDYITIPDMPEKSKSGDVDDPIGLVFRKTTSTTSDSITNSDHVTTDKNTKDYETTTASNSKTTPYKKVTSDTSTPHDVTVPDNFPDMPVKLKSVDEQCIEAGTLGFFAYTDKECVLACKNENVVTYNVDENYDIFEFGDNDDMLNFSTMLDYKEIIAQDGFPCEDNGNCQSGKCINMSISTTPNSIEKSNNFTSLSDYLTIPLGVTINNEHCQGDQCVKNLFELAPDNEDQYNQEKTLTPNGEPLLTLEAIVMLADKECEYNGAIGVSEIVDCVLHCKKFSNDFNIERYSIYAPNDFPCGNNGICSNGICTQF